MTEGQVIVDRVSTYPIYRVYILDGIPWFNDYLNKWHKTWKQVDIFSTEKGARKYCQDNNIEIEGIE